MEYKILWHDCEDDRSGEPIKVTADNPKDAYYKAIEKIKGLSAYLAEHFVLTDIEHVIDEKGNRFNPDLF